MKITNKSYIRKIKSWKGQDNYLLWLYLSKVGKDAYRITGHAYMQNYMYWDGTGINPLKINTGAKKEMLASLEEEIQLRSIEGECQ
jgi:hypothetical protein